MGANCLAGGVFGTSAVGGGFIRLFNVPFVHPTVHDSLLFCLLYFYNNC